MALKDDLRTEVESIFTTRWTERDGQKVPDPEDLRLGNDAVKLVGTVLYADLTESTALVMDKIPQFAAEIYKTYLHCAAKIIRDDGGSITSYDGDRIMAVFIGKTKNTSAARAGLKINYAVQNIVNPAIRVQYKSSKYYVRQTVGIDTSKLFVARTGIRNNNDLVWVGRAANYAAKLNSLSHETPTWITDDVYKMLLDSSKFGKNGGNMWKKMIWNSMNKQVIYCSDWWWEP